MALHSTRNTKYKTMILLLLFFVVVLCVVLWLLFAGLFQVVNVCCRFVVLGRLCLVFMEAGAGCFAFLWFWACALSVNVRLLLLLVLLRFVL